MDEVVKMVSEKTGLSAEMAKLAVTTVVGFIKGKLPPAIGSQVDGILEGKTGTEDIAGSVMKGLGGMFGGK
jgi:hypothetical protein